MISEQTCYRKVAARDTNGISKVSLAAVLPGQAGVEKKSPVRLAYGAVGATVLRARALERAVEASLRSPEPALKREELEVLLDQDIFPIDDFRSTAFYRRQAAVNLTMNVLEKYCQLSF